MNPSARTALHATLALTAAGLAAGCGASGTPAASRDWSDPAPGPSAAAEAKATPAAAPAPTAPRPARAVTVVPDPRSAPRSAAGYYPGKKLEPFWISMIAEADRAAWDDRLAAPAAADTSGREATALGTALAERPEPAADDAADGLNHVTHAPEGADFDPCVSRDGKFMVFASTQHRPTADIYLKSTSGRTVTQLTSDPANDVMPAISPDGQRVAFASSRSGNWDIYVMSAAGGQAMQITSDLGPELHPTWSPDGRKLAFCRLGETSGRWELWVTDVAGASSAEFLGYGMFPQWCPTPGTGTEGRDRILFQRSRERGDRAFSVWTLDYKPGDVSAPTEIVSGVGQAMINAAWSPDGQRIVYASIPNPAALASRADGNPSRLPQSSLWMTSIDGTQRLMLASGPFMNLMPCWSGDGRVYFVSDRTGAPNIWSIGTDKAVFAATGKRSDKAPATDYANAPAEAHEAHEK